MLYETGVEKHDCDVRFLTGSRNKAVLRMRNEKYAICICIYGRIAKIPAQLSYALVNSAMGQIPYSTERISSLDMVSSSDETGKKRCNVDVLI